MKRIANTNLTHTEAERAQRVLAKVRQRQLDLALNGQVMDSARYANRASRVRNKVAMLTAPLSSCCAA